jgi:hypothetical protein
MTLREAIAAFLSDRRQLASERNPAEGMLELMGRTFDGATQGQLADITAPRLRDFLSRRCIEERAFAGEPSLSIELIARFIRWADETSGTALADDCIPVLVELGRSIPRAIDITEALTAHLSGQGGAFAFPEFLASFEEGGRSQYDLDAPSDVGAIEGYFRVVRTDGPLVEAEDLLSGERVSPIVFPEHVARLIEEDYILNLELIRRGDDWQVSGCGFTYPPGAEL